MVALRRFRLGGFALGMCWTLSACVTSQRPAPAVSNPPSATSSATSSAANTELASGATDVLTARPSQNTDSTASAPSVAAAPACSCSEAKPKPKPKPRSKPILKEAPPQLPTASLVEHTPPGGLIDAQVRSMSVSVMSILGKRVRGANGEDLGRVVDVLSDASGRVRTAIIDFGGFLGVGNHRVAVDWPLLRFNPDGNDPSLLLSLSPDKLRTAPEYKENPRPQILMVPSTSTTAPAD